VFDSRLIRIIKSVIHAFIQLIIIIIILHFSYIYDILQSEGFRDA